MEVNQVQYPTDPYGTFRFGVEVECLLVVPEQWMLLFDQNDPGKARIQFFEKLMTKWKAVIGPDDYDLITEIKELVHLNHKPVHIGQNGEAVDTNVFYSRNWTMTEDPSVLPDENLIKVFSPRPIYGIEFVSPVMFTSSDKKIFSRTKIVIDQLYDFLESQQIELLINDTCSTHVHLSPRSMATNTNDGVKFTSGWDLERVKRVCIGSFFFEPAISAILPEHRRHSEFAVPYCELTNFLRYGGCSSEKEFLKNPYDESKHIIDALLKMPEVATMGRDIQNGRYWGWNFKNLVANKLGGEAYGTIEMRRPPGSKTAAEALIWIEFATTFALACVEHGDELYTIKPSKESMGVKALAKFIVGKAEMGSAFGPELKRLFEDNKVDINAIFVEAQQPHPHLSDEEKARLEAQPNIAAKKIYIDQQLEKKT